MPLLGAIVGCHCSVLWLGGKVTTNFRGGNVVLLLGAIVGCHCSVLWCGEGRVTLGEWTFHCRAVAPYTAMACRKSIQKNCLKLLADITLFSIHWYHKNWFLLSGVYAGIIYIYISVHIVMTQLKWFVDSAGTARIPFFPLPKRPTIDYRYHFRFSLLLMVQKSQTTKRKWDFNYQPQLVSSRRISSINSIVQLYINH